MMNVGLENELVDWEDLSSDLTGSVPEEDVGKRRATWKGQRLPRKLLFFAKYRRRES